MLRELKGGPSTHKGQRRHRRKRLFWLVCSVVGVVALLALILVLLYVWYTGQHAKVQVSELRPKPINVLKAPAPIAENQNVGVYIIELTSPLTAGSNASVSIRTLPRSACSIDVVYNGLKSVDIGLIPKDADEYGVVRWTWKVEQGQPVGKWPVNITCARNGSSGYMRGDLVIIK